MTNVADRYISESGRQPHYDRAAFIDDLLEAGNFLVWAEEDGAMYAGVEARAALQAMCRMLDINPRGLRKAIMGPAEGDGNPGSREPRWGKGNGRDRK